ncbi:hypothetical protein KEM56_007894 [Ascosphaera pollenicola]|nr:hypothetical protein KEM56_007894 [Ascosphaera pollenicola]
MASRDSSEQTSPITVEDEQQKTAAVSLPQDETPTTDGKPSTSGDNLLFEAVREWEENGQRTPNDLKNYEIAEKAGIKLRLFKDPKEEPANGVWIDLYLADVHRRLHGESPLIGYEEGAPELQLAAAGKAAGLWCDHPWTHPEPLCGACERRLDKCRENPWARPERYCTECGRACMH